MKKNSRANAWLSQIAGIKELAPEQEHALFEKLRRGDAQAREELITRNLQLVIRVAKQFRGRGLPLEDLVQEGAVGLIEVLDRFDHRRGIRFAVYAFYWILQAMQGALRRQCSHGLAPLKVSVKKCGRVVYGGILVSTALLGGGCASDLGALSKNACAKARHELIPEMLEDGLKAYDKADPLKKQGLRYGSLGERMGKKGDKLVFKSLEGLKKRFPKQESDRASDDATESGA